MGSSKPRYFKVSYTCSDKHRNDRLLMFAGDACHVMVPIGGFGMNTGILDAYDLGWKLVATLNGWGGEKLLATYTVRTIHELLVASLACANFQSLLHPRGQSDRPQWTLYR